MDADHESAPFASSGLLTDLYELTMAAAYWQRHIEAEATFEVVVRDLPPRRNYLVAAGLDQVLDFVERVRFSDDEVAWLRSLALFRHVHDGFFDWLRQFRFTGEIWALPEGSAFFAGEPVLRISAPIAEAQLLETSILSTLHLQTLVASKAARVTYAAGDHPVVEFGSRRAHGVEAAVLAARAAFLGGCSGTSNAYAGQRFDIPAFGTQAHSWIMAHEDEGAAFRDFLEIFPEQATLLVDTYDVRAAVERVLQLDQPPAGIRLDSGDLCVDSIWARERLDAAGWTNVRIFASGDLSEERIEALLQAGARIDAFGVGTALSTSAEAPALGLIYKLVETRAEGRVRMTAKFSAAKKTYPGRKQVFRGTGNDGRFSSDVIALEDEAAAGASALLFPVMRDGRRLEPALTGAAALHAARARFLAERDRLPAQLLALTPASPPFAVRYSPRLEALAESVRPRGPARRQARPRVASNAPAPSRTTIFWEVDMQHDFIDRDGALSIAGGDRIVPNVERLVDAVRQRRVFLLSDVDVHLPSDPEMRDWPLHCIQGTRGAEIIPEALAANPLFIPNQPNVELPSSFADLQQVVLEKNTLDVFDNPNTDPLLQRLPAVAPYFAPDAEFVVFGVATEYCVRKVVDGLLARRRKVALVTDAIAPVDASVGRKLVEEFRAGGVRILTTDEALQLLASPLETTNTRRAS